jgi:hypothetical protein
LEDTLAQAIEENLVDSKGAFLFQAGSQVHKLSADSTKIPVGTEARIGIDQFGHTTVIMEADARNSAAYHLGGRACAITTSWALQTLLVREEGGNFVISDASIAAFKNECEKYGTTFTLSKEKVKYEGDYSAYILGMYSKGQLREELWIDPDRGYICPKQLRFDLTDGAVESDMAAENFILDEPSQKWFPQKVTHSAWMGKKPNIITACSEVHVMPGTLMINRPIPDSVFALTIPKGMRIADTRREDNDKTAFIANQPGTLDLPAAEQKDFLDHAEWLSTRPVRQYEPPFEIKKASLSWTRIVFISIGIILIIIGLIRYFFFKQ